MSQVNPVPDIDLEKIREKLSASSGKKYWRSLDELAETPEFREYLQEEYPKESAFWDRSLSRRDFLKVMGASFLLMGLGGCARQPAEKIIPYVKSPEDIVPGRPLFFATAMSAAGFGQGLLVESHMGRPTKAEGNPDHPQSMGATDIFAQSSVLSLYDPDRSQTLIERGLISNWETFIKAVEKIMQPLRAAKGKGLRILSEPTTSPSMIARMQRFMAALPEAQWHQYEPILRDAERMGLNAALGEVPHYYYQLDKADVIVSLDSNFLSDPAAGVRYSRDFAARREITAQNPKMNRLYVAEPMPTITGTMADHRLAAKSGRIEAMAQLLAAELGISVSGNPGAGLSEAEKAWVRAAAGDLKENFGRGIVMAGLGQPAEVHEAVHAMNNVLQNAGKTVIYTARFDSAADPRAASISTLVRDMNAGQVGVLLILGGNPVFNAPADLKFGEALSRVAVKIRLGLYDDETSRNCDWHIPEAHFLESWGDIRAFDGTVSIVQPLIAPLYGGRSAHEVIAAFEGEAGRTGYDVVKSYWQSVSPDSFDAAWEKALHDGLIRGSALAPKATAVRQGFSLAAAAAKADAVEVNFRPDPTINDGRYANNGWLQELPKPLTNLTWDNAAHVAPDFAQQNGLAQGDLIEIKSGNTSVTVPVFVLPGHALNSVTVHLGYGRTRGGRVAKGAGFDVYPLRASRAMWTLDGASVRKTGKKYKLVGTQTHHNMEGRHLVRSASVEEFLKDPHFVKEGEHGEANQSLYPKREYKDYAWGMTINLNACTGCGACVLACQSENNIPVVGKNEVGNGREMHWIRVDHYYEGNMDNPGLHNMPVPCMHCENAPCEPVCPVEATSHSSEGLNEMTYNRCVGTRYCANNCPYKVRRFNFLEYTQKTTPAVRLGANPDVTIRTRGVMEKCTYCVQRINVARITAKKEDRKIKDGEIVTACQQVCPARAITFGDLNDKSSQIAQSKKDPRNYGLLTELNTAPRTTYLAKIKNPNPALGGASHHG